jgi:hypothetical protein
MSANELDLTPPVKPAKEAKAAKAPKEPKAEKAPKEPKPEKAPSNRVKLAKTYPEDAKLEVLVNANPKKPGSRAYAIFEFYAGSKTVGDFFVATAEYVAPSGKKQPGTYGDITYDVGHGFIKVG